MKKLVVLIPLAVALVWTASAAASTSSLIMGRANLSAADGCVKTTPIIPPGAVSAQQVAVDMALRGIPVATYAQLSMTGTAEKCAGQIQYMNWADLRTFRDTHGWTIGAAGSIAQSYTTLTAQQVYDSSCGAIPTYTANGVDPTAFFAYPNGMHNATTDATVLSCFQRARFYAYKPNPAGAKVIAVSSITGGACNDPTLPCYNYQLSQSPGGRYFDPARITALLDANGWNVIQPYRFVTGAYGVAGVNKSAWDCTSLDWHAHWAEGPETYCYTDFLAAVDAATTTWVQP